MKHAMIQINQMYTVFCDNILLIIAVNSMRIHERHIVIEPNQKSLDFLAKPKQKNPF